MFKPPFQFVCAAALLTVASASAADLALRGTVAPDVSADVAPAAGWEGAYGGVFAGGAWGLSLIHI
ncbi:MAG: hypothetical protein N2444_03975, partial [Methylocystis sp.]|nr:hypothetical protein [Methylocystis sp.]